MWVSSNILTRGASDQKLREGTTESDLAETAVV